MNWKKFFAILEMAPAIIGLVKQVETTVVGPKLGPLKLDLVLSTIRTATEAVPEVRQSISQGSLESAVVKIAEATVATMNAAKGSLPAAGGTTNGN